MAISSSIMIPFRLQAFAVIILVIATIPEQTNALKCYTCDNCDKPAESDAKDCADGESCFKSGAKRGCYAKDKVECLKKEAGGECYKPEADADKAIAGKLKDCLGEEPTGLTCACDTALCNGESTGSGKGSNSSAGRNSGGGGGKCYACEGKKGSDCDKGGKLNLTQKTCSSHNFCSLERLKDADASSPVYVIRKCHDWLELAQCFKQTFGNACHSDGSQEEDRVQVQKCAAEKSKQEYAPHKEKSTECVCEGDLCNEAAGIKTTPLLITVVSAVISFVV